jgi:hypothetical protein
MICTHIQGENCEFTFIHKKEFFILSISMNYNKIRDMLYKGKFKVLQIEVLKTSVR